MQKKIIAFGTFDILHPGHENFLKQARKRGDYLIIVIARDKTVKEVKGKLPVNNERVRKNNVLKLKIADKVVLGNLKDKYATIKKFKPDVVCLGYDQKHFIDGLRNTPLRKEGRGVKIVKLKPYKPSIYKSSKIFRQQITDSRRQAKHKSVGAIIKKGNEVLMIDRKKFPFGWACPAGHVNEWESPKKALKREVKEETGLDVLKYKLLFHEFVPWNKCSRGVKGHDWYVYEILEWKGSVRRNKREEKKIEWVNVEDIGKLKLERVWKVWFEKLNFLK